MIKTLSNTARRILDSLVIKNSVVKIPPGKTEAGVYGKNGMLERDLYDEVNAALIAPSSNNIRYPSHPE